MLSKKNNETNIQYIRRIVYGKLMDKTIDEDFVELYYVLFNKEVSSTEARKRFYGIKDMLECVDEIEIKEFDDCEFYDIEDKLKELELQKFSIEKERKKLQTTKLEHNKWLRENARDELITEMIVEAIKELKPLEIPQIIPYKPNDRAGVLLFGDEHYGAEFEILGLYGETLNKYNPEIFEERMWSLLEQTVEIVKRENLTVLNVFSTGDGVDGMLRISQLMKLRYGVVEGTVKYAHFITNWLNTLTKYVNVRFQMVNGNHTELRMLGQPKGTFTKDNMGVVVYESIKNMLENNLNFEMIKNPTGYIFDNICGFNVLGIHGEVKSMENAIKNFAHTYKTEIDILIAGHLHHTRTETVGVNKDVINVPSIIGVDDFSMSLNKTSNAGATLIIIEEEKGKVLEYNIKLN